MTRRFILSASSFALAIAGCSEAPKPAPPATQQAAAAIHGSAIDGSDESTALVEPVADGVLPSSDEIVDTQVEPPVELTDDDRRIIADSLEAAKNMRNGFPLADLGTPDQDRSGYLGLSFKDLGEFRIPLIGISDRIRGKQPAEVLPKELNDLNEKQISIKGFMMPILVNGSECTSFMLVRDRMFCCFGAKLGLTDAVMVNMAPGKSTRPLQDVIITVYGRMAVSPEIIQDQVVSLFNMNDAEVKLPD